MPPHTTEVTEKTVWRAEDDPQVAWSPGAECGPRAARAVALQALYEADVTGHPARGAARRLAQERRLKRGDARLAQRLAGAAEERRAELDARIGEVAPARPPQDISAIDRNILRLALAELDCGRNVSAALVVNEAVELAKLFGAEGSQRFVNGVLGTVLG